MLCVSFLRGLSPKMLRTQGRTLAERRRKLGYASDCLLAGQQDFAIVGLVCDNLTNSYYKFEDLIPWLSGARELG